MMENQLARNYVRSILATLKQHEREFICGARSTAVGCDPCLVAYYCRTRLSTVLYGGLTQQTAAILKLHIERAKDGCDLCIWPN